MHIIHIYSTKKKKKKERELLHSRYCTFVFENSVGVLKEQTFSNIQNFGVGKKKIKRKKNNYFEKSLLLINAAFY